MPTQSWLIYAVLSAVAAAFVGICGKMGMREVDPTLATSVRSIIMSLLLAGFCTISGHWSRLSSIHGRALTMIGLSGLAGAVSWLFYFRAIHLGTVAQVAPIDKLSMPLTVILAVLLLGERPNSINWMGVGLIVAGAYLAAMPSTP